MSSLFIILSVAEGLVSLVLIGIILMQKKNASGIAGSIAGMGGGSGQTYWDKNKGRSLEGQLEKYTKFLAVIFFALALVLNLIK